MTELQIIEALTNRIAVLKIDLQEAEQAGEKERAMEIFAATSRALKARFSLTNKNPVNREGWSLTEFLNQDDGTPR